MSEILFHPGDPTKRVRSARVSPLAGAVLAGLLVAGGTAAFTGLLGAPALISDLVRSADRLALRETARRGAEAYSSVLRQTARLGARLADDELFVARLAACLGIPRPDGFPGDPPAVDETKSRDLTSDVAALARRLRAAELFRRRIGLATHDTTRADAARVPSRAPVEPSVAVPVTRFGMQESAVTHRPEFYPGLELAAPEGTPVVSPADGTVVWAGPLPGKVGAEWRALGTVVVVAHDARTMTLFGHLGRALVRARQRVRRGDAIARVGRSGFVAAPRLAYQVRVREGERWVPRDPRLYVLDATWITAAEARAEPAAPADEDLPPPLR